MRDAFVRVLSRLARENDRIFLITGDLGFGVLTDYWTTLPAQFLNAGVAEQNMTGLATGLALDGRVVFTYSIANFPTLRCLEQIRNDAAYHDADVKIVAVGGGFSYGALGMSHHATEDIAVLRALPNLTVVVPGTVWEAEQATAAIAARPGTCYLRLDKSHGTEPAQSPAFEIGRARRLREGSDVTIIAAGGILGEAQDAAEALAAEGVACRVVSMHTIKPLDVTEVMAACRETGAVMTLEEHGADGGLGSAVAEACMDAGIWPRRAARLALRAGFSSVVGSQLYLRTHYGLDKEAVVQAVRRLLNTPERA
jgi:transketolase